MNDSGYSVTRTYAQHPLFKNRGPLLNHLDIELTERCNNACIHCNINQPMSLDTARKRELTTEQWKELLRQAADLGALSVRFTGGEPLLREDFAELYLCARKLGLSVVLFTNGRLITTDLAELFARIPPLKKIEISIYGMLPESSLSITCSREAFNESRKGVKLLIEKGIPFAVKSVLLPPNRSEIDVFASWCTAMTGSSEPPPHTLILDLRARRDSIEQNRLIAGMRLSPMDVVAFNQRRDEDYRREKVRFCTQFSGPKGDLLFSCGAGRGGCVDAYGNYQMCLPLRHPRMVYPLEGGSLREGLEDVFPIFRNQRAENPEYLRRCAHCFLMGSLCSQCPAKSWMEHGTLDTPVEYLCSVTHAEARHLGILGEGELAWEIDDWEKRLKKLSSAMEVHS